MCWLGALVLESDSSRSKPQPHRGLGVTLCEPPSPSGKGTAGSPASEAAWEDWDGRWNRNSAGRSLSELQPRLFLCAHVHPNLLKSKPGSDFLFNLLVVVLCALKTPILGIEPPVLDHGGVDALLSVPPTKHS